MTRKIAWALAQLLIGEDSGCDGVESSSLEQFFHRGDDEEQEPADDKKAEEGEKGGIGEGGDELFFNFCWRVINWASCSKNGGEVAALFGDLDHREVDPVEGRGIAFERAGKGGPLFEMVAEVQKKGMGFVAAVFFFDGEKALVEGKPGFKKLGRARV